jgi:hypothetical protein
VQVLASGPVLRHDSGPQGSKAASALTPVKQRRILVLTDAPRLLFLDPVGNIVRGSLELGGTTQVDTRMVRHMHHAPCVFVDYTCTRQRLVWETIIVMGDTLLAVYLPSVQDI